MKLTGFEEGGEHDLFWVEDYPADNPNCDKGIKKKDDWDSNRTNICYRNKKDVYKVDFPVGITHLLILTCVSRSDVQLILTIVKKGMAERQCHIQNIPGKGDEKSEYMTVILPTKKKKAYGLSRNPVELGIHHHL